MSNKTSDKNVGNKIKQQTENTIKYYKNIDNIEEVPIDILRAMYKDILSDYTRQKQINEEHKKINGELREKVKELEEENLIQRKQIMSIFDRGYISKQVVKEGLEDIEDYFDRLNGPDEDIEYIKQIKQELLGGEKNNENIKS